MLHRLLRPLVESRLRSHGAVLVEGAKAVGKTTLALSVCASSVRLDRDRAARQAADVDPTLVLDGAEPRLIDEFQLVPDLWNAIRARLDDTGRKGCFVITGSSTAEDSLNSHSGAGRMARLTLRTLTLHELGRSSGVFSLQALLDGNAPPGDAARMSVRDIAEHLVRGGWPGHLHLSWDEAMDANQDYLDTLVHVDVPQVTGGRRDPERLRRLLRGLARNVSTPASMRAIAKQGEATPSPNTLSEDMKTLQRLFVIEEQPAWAPRLRSRVRLASLPKRHLTDPSLAVAALQATPERLLREEIEWTGFLFESLVVHELKAYVQAQRCEVLHYRDNKGFEVDAIIERRDGRWLAVEIKLGAGAIEAAAQRLLQFLGRLDASTASLCAGLVVVVADSPTYRRPEGVWVTSLASLGP